LNPSSAGSIETTFAAERATIVPPYCGTPRLSHQFLLATVVVVVAVVVVAVVVVVLVVVVVAVVDVVVGCVAVVVVDVLPQDAISIAATINKLEPSKINLFFNFLLLSPYIFAYGLFLNV